MDMSKRRGIRRTKIIFSIKPSISASKTSFLQMRLITSRAFESTWSGGSVVAQLPFPQARSQLPADSHS